MPQRPGRWCGKCRKVHPGKCPAAPVWQKPVKARSGRGGRPWRRLREQVFKRDGYLCQECLRGGVVQAVTVSGKHAGICDHIIPVEEGGTDDPANLQTLCQSCSNRKTQQESIRARTRGSKFPGGG